MTKQINFRELAERMLADAAAFEKRADTDDKYPVLSGQPWCITTEDGSHAILVKHSDDGKTFSMHPTYVQPHLCGFSCMDRGMAEAVLKHYEDLGWRLTQHRDIARIRAESLRETGEYMLANIDQMEA